MYYDLIVIHLVIAYAHELHYKHHTKMKMNKFHFNKHKLETWQCDLLILCGLHSMHHVLSFLYVILGFLVLTLNKINRNSETIK